MGQRGLLGSTFLTRLKLQNVLAGPVRFSSVLSGSGDEKRDILCLTLYWQCDDKFLVSISICPDVLFLLNCLYRQCCFYIYSIYKQKLVYLYKHIFHVVIIILYNNVLIKLTY